MNYNLVFLFFVTIHLICVQILYAVFENERYYVNEQKKKKNDKPEWILYGCTKNSVIYNPIFKWFFR